MMTHTIATTKQKSIQGQITMSLFVVCTLIFCLIELFILERTHKTLWNALDQDLKIRAQFLTSIINIENGEFDYDREDITLPEYNTDNGTAFFVILEAKNLNEIVRSQSLSNPKYFNQITFPQKPITEPIYWTQKINNETIRLIAVRQVIQRDEEDDREPNKIKNDDIRIKPHEPLNDPNQPDVLGLFVVGSETAEIESQFNMVLRLTTVALGLGLLILLWTGRRILHRNLKLLANFRDEVSDISAQNLKPVKVPEVTEIADIASTLNHVVDHLDQVFQRERQFTSNVAHELRTPISEIRTLSEVALEYSDDLNTESRENYESILDSSIHLQNILENLLILSRFDFSQLKTKPTEFDLNDVLLPALNRLKNAAENRNLTFELQAPDNCIMLTDEHMLQTVLDNLLANAVSYSPEKSTINIEIQCEPQKIEIVISNPVMDLTETDLPFIFDRFWRKQQVRSTEDCHSGLGLPIAQALLTQLGFQILVSLVGGTIFQVKISGQRNP